MAIGGAVAAMMAKMGHKAGQGLGRNHQGISSAIHTRANDRHQGLGYGLNRSAVAGDWTPTPANSAVQVNQAPLTREEVCRARGTAQGLRAGHAEHATTGRCVRHATGLVHGCVDLCLARHSA
jgi:hypothetical protein